MKQLERVLKALANKRRLVILQFLKRTVEASVGEISQEIGLSFKTTSKHLGILAGVDILEKEQRRLKVFYRLSKKQTPAARRILSLL